MIGLQHYLLVAGVVFCLGLFGLVARRNVVCVLMSVELMLNAANINLAAFSRFAGGGSPGHLFSFVVIVVAVCEIAVALAIVVTLFRIKRTTDLDLINTLRG